MKLTQILTLGMMTFFVACNAQEQKSNGGHASATTSNEMGYNVEKSDSAWRASLTDAQYRVLREKGTERPHTGEYNLHFENGIYTCAGCGAELFSSEAKFDSHCGWPSFDKALSSNTVVEIPDNSHGMVRTEIVCANCGGHLGHVFDDGPTETGMRYCINSVSLGFEEESSSSSEEK
ncbi:MAG: peptide-methionine (R)-S-oxide reductase [Bacteroidetes bacterium]|nr:MAG: peptide-methionine (R)-S-oxide reductase [Bacteroidota bacterium]